MHFEVLVEDRSGSVAIEIILEKMFGGQGVHHSWRVFSYKGLGRIQKGLRPTADPTKRQLLSQLPRLLRGYGKSLQNMADTAAVIVVVDLDRRDCMEFKRELLAVLNACSPRPRTLFRIAIEESEAWLLGDREAVKAAYPKAKEAVLNGYEQDSICGTWEVLADAVHPGGAGRLKQAGWIEAGEAKSEWAASIASRMNVDANRSRSFQVFRDGLNDLVRLHGDDA